MNKEQERLTYLFQRYIDKTLNLPERKELWGLIQQSEKQDWLKGLIRQEIGKTESGLFTIDKGQTQAEADKVFQNILAEAGKIQRYSPDKETKIVSINRSFSRAGWKRGAVAASITLFITIGSYFLFFADRTKQSKLANLPQQQRFSNDIVPAKEEITITLADGTTKILDSAGNGTVTVQGNSQVIQNDGELSYVVSANPEVVFNTIHTGKGRTLHLQLADGTGVWLDALSSIYFPTAFPGNERVVEITGQAYFEVAPAISPQGRGKKPFKVKSGDQVVEVLGTHFNINSYNLQNIQTTLLEGAVEVKAQNGHVKLIPGEQSLTTSNKQLAISRKVNLEQVMAWKNGRFQFNESSIEDIMNTLSKWYDIEVEYKDKTDKAFVARIDRDMPISKLLELLEMTKQIKFAVEGNRVTVMKW